MANTSNNEIKFPIEILKWRFRKRKVISLRKKLILIIDITVSKKYLTETMC